jgi:hypothetical protein
MSGSNDCNPERAQNGGHGGEHDKGAPCGQFGVCREAESGYPVLIP